MEGTTATPTIFNAPVKSKSQRNTNDAKRPVKNQFYCPASRKQKMLFKTEEEADRFIQYNGHIILDENGFAPTRSYYCKACGGWHVTSQSKNRDYETRQQANNEHRQQAKRKKNIEQNLDKAETCIDFALENLHKKKHVKAIRQCREARKYCERCLSNDILPERKRAVLIRLSKCYDLCEQIISESKSFA